MSTYRFRNEFETEVVANSFFGTNLEIEFKLFGSCVRLGAYFNIYEDLVQPYEGLS